MAVMTEKPELIDTDKKPELVDTDKNVAEQETKEFTERDIILGPHPRKSTNGEPKK